VPQKYCTIDLICVQRKTYSLESLKTIMVKKSPLCNNVQPLIRDVVWQTSKC